MLIAEDLLLIGETLLTRLEEKFTSARWRELDEDVRNGHARHVALLDGELRGELGVGDLTETLAFYNAYYWALVSAKRYQTRYGFDAGIKQEALKVLERAPADADWQVVERINEAAQQA